MSAHSKKNTEINTYGDVFGDLAHLATEDSGEITTFAFEVIDREVTAKDNLGELVGKGWNWVRNHGDLDRIFSAEQKKLYDKASKILEHAADGNYAQLLKQPRFFKKYEAEIVTQVSRKVNDAITELYAAGKHAEAAAMQKNKDNIVSDVAQKIETAIQQNQIYVTENGQQLLLEIKRPIEELGGKIKPIKLDKATLQNEIHDIHLQQDNALKNFNESREVINKRPVPTKGKVRTDSNGRSMFWNGTKWVLIGGAAITGWQNKDKIMPAIGGFFGNNSETTLSGGGKSNSGSEKSDGYDSRAEHDTPADVLNQYDIGGGAQQAPQTPQYHQPQGQDSWEQFKSTPKRRFSPDATEGNWWSSPSSEKPVYDDLGYVGGSDESWSRIAEKVSPDELDDRGLADYGADQVVAAQNFLSYYGLSSGQNPAVKIVPSLLIQSFDGMSFDEYKRTHSEEQTRMAMKKFEQGLSMFSKEMTKIANNLEGFYRERQRRQEAELSAHPTATQKPNEPTRN